MNLRSLLNPGTAVLLVVALAVPHVVAGPSPTWRTVLAGMTSLAYALLAVRAVARMPSTPRPPWIPVAAAVAVNAATALPLGRLDAVFAGHGASPLALHPLHLLGTGLLVLGLGAMTGRDGAGRRAVLLDAAIVLTAISTVVGALLVAPAWEAFVDTPAARATVAAYAILNLLLVFAAIRLLLARARLSLSSLLLTTGVGGHVIVAAGLGVHVVTGAGGDTLLHAGRLLADGLVVLSLLAPSAAGVPRRFSPPTHVSPHRAFVLVAATLLLPATMLLRAPGTDHLLIAVMTAVVLVLISARFWQLFSALSRHVEKEISEHVARNERRFAALVRHTTDILIVVDSGGVVTYANPAANSMFGTDPTGWDVNQLAASIHPSERRATVAAVLDRIEGSQGDPARLNARLLDVDGQEQYIDLVVVDLRADEDVNGVVLTLQETTERTELERQLRHLAFHDALTGLGNRELFKDRLEHALSRITRSGGRIALLMCDLDDFKDVNDTLGHAAGDALLVTVAERLREVTRASDTIARLGGDEFAILSEDVDSTGDAATMARRLLSATEEPIRVAGHELRVGLSVGVAVDTGERSAEELLRDADVALYEAKGQGKRRWALHRATMTLRNQARLHLADDLAHALIDGGLDVAFQPIVAVDDGRFVGVEALARWEHPERGAVSPREFVDVAESSGLVTAIGHYVLDTALATLRRCLEARPGSMLRMGVNVSARELHEPALADHVIGRLHHHGIDPSMLVLELTESSMLHDITLTLAVMYRLRTHGVRFAVDDFGTGYSSLSYLRRLPVDIVKIDRSFVEDLGADSSAIELVRAIVDLGATLRLDVCAEGVETSEQLDVLAGMGCPFAQGYLIGRPITADAFVEQYAHGSRSDLPAPGPRVPGSSEAAPGADPDPAGAAGADHPQPHRE